MGCITSRQQDGSGIRRRPSNIGEVAVFVPGLRVPQNVDFFEPLGNILPKNLLERLSALRTRVVVMVAQEAPTLTRRRRTATRHGGSPLSNLLQAVEDYLPVLLGLVKEGSQLMDKVRFAWINQEDDAEETALATAWYEVLSVLHLMATIRLSEANLLLLPKPSSDGYHLRVSEDCRRTSVDVLLKAAGYLDCAIRHVLPNIPPELRNDLPIDIAEGVLRAQCMQALGQGVDVQLGLAIDSPKATLAVKRRLACEMVKYWHQAQENISQLQFSDGWGTKHRLFVKWKYVAAKAAAYYYHGLILDEGNTEKSHRMAVAALQAADEFLKESKKACEAFNTSPPLSRSPTLWGSMKYLADKIPKDTSSKAHINKDLYNQERILETAPPLPDFALALKPDDYQLPAPDASWNRETSNQIKSQKA